MKKTAVLFILIFSFSIVFSQTKSYKRGVAHGYHSVKDMENFSPYISWWYNWAASPESTIRQTYSNYNVDFTPMAWNASGIGDVKNWVDRDTMVKYILGFNEPNFKSQANMTPSQAASKWPLLQKIATDNNLKIVSPAVNYCGECVSENGTTYYNPFDYLDDFFDACNDCQVDYVGLHWYGGGNTIMDYIETGRKYNKPIWVTEFAAWDGSVKNIGDQKKYLAGTVNFLERDPDVYRYSWFIGRRSDGLNSNPFIDLYGDDGMFTELGQLYMDIPVYDPDFKTEIPGRIEAEEYYLMSGLFSEPTSDTDGFLNIGWTDVNDWAEYKISVAKSGIYNLNARISGSNAGIIYFQIDGISAVTLNTPYTGGWQSWKTVSSEIELEAGEHILKMLIRDAGFNINWIDISSPTFAKNDIEIIQTEVHPNPVSNGILNVTLNGANSGGEYICTLFDLNGKKVFSKNVNPNRIMFQVNINENIKVKPGIYNLNIVGKNGVANRLIVVK